MIVRVGDVSIPEENIEGILLDASGRLEIYGTVLHSKTEKLVPKLKEMEDTKVKVQGANKKGKDVSGKYFFENLGTIEEEETTEYTAVLTRTTQA